MTKLTALRRAALGASAICTATMLAGGAASAATAASAPDGVRISMAAAAACGLYRDGDAAMYRNCSGGNERILVTYIWSGSEYFCVPPNESRYVGRWSNTFRTYIRGTC